MKIIKNTVITLISNIILFSMGIITNIIISRYFGVENRGFYSLIFNSIALYSCFLSLGLFTSNVYYLSKEKSKFSVIFSNSIFYLIIMSGILGCLFFSFPNLVHFLFPKFLNFPLIGLTVLSIILLTILLEYLKSFLLSLDKIKEYNSINIVLSSLYLIFVLIFIIFLKKNIIGIFYAWILASFISIFMHLKILLKTEKFKFGINIREFITSIKLGFKSLTINIIGFLMIRIDIFIIRSLLGMRFLGLYSVATGTAELLNQIPYVFGLMLFPKVKNVNKDPKFDGYIIKLFRINFFFSIVFGLILFLISSPVVYLFYGKEFIEAGTTIKFLIIGNIFMGTLSIINNYIVGKKGIIKIFYISQGLSVLSNILLNIILIPYFGINGAAIACSTSYFVAFIVMFKYFAKLTNYRYKEILFIQKQDFVIISKYIKNAIISDKNNKKLMVDYE